MLNNKLAAVDARIEELHQLRGELTALLDRSARLDPSDCWADEICHILNR